MPTILSLSLFFSCYGKLLIFNLKLMLETTAQCKDNNNPPNNSNASSHPFIIFFFRLLMTVLVVVPIYRFFIHMQTDEVFLLFRNKTNVEYYSTFKFVFLRHTKSLIIFKVVNELFVVVLLLFLNFLTGKIRSILINHSRFVKITWAQPQKTFALQSISDVWCRGLQLRHPEKIH